MNPAWAKYLDLSFFRPWVSNYSVGLCLGMMASAGIFIAGLVFNLEYN